MSSIVIEDNEFIVITPDIGKAIRIKVSSLLAQKSDLEDRLSTFDQRSAARKLEVNAKMDADHASIKLGMQEKVSELDTILQRAILAGLVL